MYIAVGGRRPYTFGLVHIHMTSCKHDLFIDNIKPYGEPNTISDVNAHFTSNPLEYCYIFEFHHRGIYDRNESTK